MSRDAKSLIVCAAALALMAACSDGAQKPNPDSPESATPDAPEKPREDAASKAVDAVADGIDEKVRAIVEGALTAEASRKYLDETKPKRRRNDPLHYREELTQLYESKDLGLLKGGGLSATGEVVHNALKAAPTHAMTTKRFHLPELEKALAQLAKANEKAAGHPRFTLAAASKEKVVALARKLEAPSEDAIVSRLLEDGTPDPALKKSADAYRGLLKDRAKAAAKAEILLADALLAYSWDMKYQNPAWFPEETFPKKIEDRRVKLRARMVKDVDAARGEGLTAYVEGLPPKFEQYERLRGALARYSKIKEDGGWEKVGRIPGAKIGRRGKRYIKLKKRLAAEGFLELGAEPSDEFDKATDLAVRKYQETHQLNVDGEPNRWFWKSIDTSLDDRIQQIEINLRRWRQTRIGHDDYYIHVNIPDFHAEIWRDGVMDYRYRVVVGSRTIACDRSEGRLRRVNATPLFSDELEMVILNPYWNVPERIFKEEIVPEMVKSPTYLEDEGYECVATDADGLCKRVRQLSGEGNALGLVKFIFPNQHGVYMHDTAKKRLFDLPVRAFSHGCMRVHEPFKLVEKLLGHDGQYDKKQIDKILGHGKEHGIRLKKVVPVHIEYYTVRVDEDENVHFLADVYRYDREIITGESAVGAKCEPEPLAELTVEPESQPDSEAGSQPADGTPTNGADGEAGGDGAAAKEGEGASKPKVGIGLNLPGLGAAKPKVAIPSARKLDRAVEKAKAKDDEDDGTPKVDDIGP